MLCETPTYLGELSLEDVPLHSVAWNVEVWREKFEGSSHASLLDEIHKKWGDEIQREDLLRFSKAIEHEDLPTLFLGSMIWGRPRDQGLMGLIVDFRKTLESPGAYDKLVSLYDTLVDPSAGALAAYRRLMVGGDCRLPNIGPSFGTKILYFFGYRNVRAELRPLVWDRRVATALWDEGCRFWRAYSHWDPDAYEIYLRLAKRWATSLELEGSDVHLVEYALFKRNEQKERPDRKKWKLERAEVLAELRNESARN